MPFDRRRCRDAEAIGRGPPAHPRVDGLNHAQAKIDGEWFRHGGQPPASHHVESEFAALGNPQTIPSERKTL
jgi:hypothetical protein